MRRVAFLSTDSLDAFVTYDALAVAPLAARGWAVEAVPWRAAVDWGRWEAVVVRSPWDYQDHPAAFLDVLAAIDASPAHLANPLGVMRWNLDKHYLQALAARGVPTVPTVWGERLTAADVAALHDLLGGEVVVKPTVSANADGATRVAPGASAAPAVDALAGRAWMAQPFVPSVVAEGETSVFLFGGHASHAVLKRPADGDFRVQEEHGGTIRAVPLAPALVDAATRAVVACEAETGTGQPLLYARADLVRWQGAWVVMEVELVEPSLYFAYDDASADRFADAFVAWMEGGGGSPEGRTPRARAA